VSILDDSFWAVDGEFWSVVALLDEADRAIGQLADRTARTSPLLAVASSAAEHLLKLTLGFKRYADSGEWPSNEIRQFGHDIVGLDGVCRQLIRDHTSDGAAPWVATCLEDADRDEVLSKWLTVLRAYADQGRYEHLEAVAGTAKHTPTRMLGELQADLIDIDRFASPDGDRIAAEQNARLLLANCRWRNLYGYAWAHGLMGSDAKRYGLFLVRRS
jgi:hypothetical protein